MKRSFLLTAVASFISVSCAASTTFQATETVAEVEHPIAVAAQHVLNSAKQLHMLMQAPGVATPTEEFLNATVDATSVYFEALQDLADRIATEVNVDAAVLLNDWKRMDAVHRTAVMFALTQLNQPYIRDPERSSGQDGYDCSGLTLVAFYHAGITLQHKAYVQQLNADPVAPYDQPGDLVFFKGGDTAGGEFDIGHVGIYLGEGLMVNARAGVERVAIERVADIAERYPAEHWGRVVQDASG